MRILWRSDYREVWFVLAFTAVVVGIAFFVTRVGTVFFGDSPEYFAGAFSMVKYGSMFDASGRPFTHWAPLYSWMQLPAYYLGLPPLSWARGINVTLVALWSMMNYQIMRTVLGVRWIALATATLVLLWHPLTIALVFIGSEAALLFFLSLLLYAMVKISVRYSSRWFVVAVCASVLLVYTRYAGLFIVIGVAVFMFRALSRQAQKPVVRTISYLLLSLLPLCPWLLRNKLASGLVSNRTLHMHVFSLDQIGSELARLFENITYFGDHIAVMAVLLLCGVGTMIVLYKKVQLRHSAIPRFATLTGIVALTYLFLFIASIFFLDQSTSFSERLLAPFYYLVFLTLVPLADAVLRALDFNNWRRAVAYGFVGSLLTWEIVGFVAVRPSLLEWRTTQQRELAAFRRVAAELGAVQLFSNSHQFIFFATHQFVEPLPNQLDPYHGGKNTAYERELRHMVDAVNKGALIISIADLYTPATMSEREIQETPHIGLVGRYGGIKVYGRLLDE